MKFSIITCTFNSEGYVQKNIDSVENQTFQDFEHVFIDGFSTDRTIEIIEKYKEKFPEKVKLFQFEPKGIGNAMNKGIEKSSGEYLIHLHSDDSFYNNVVLEDVKNFIEEKNKPDWLYGQINVVEKNDNSMGIFPKHKLLQLGDTAFGKYLLKFFNFIPHQSVFIKKEIFDRFGKFDESLKSEMDYDLWLKILKDTHWIFFSRTISNYKIRPEAQSSGKKNKAINYQNLQKVQKKYLNFLEYGFAHIVNKILDKINKTLR